MKKFKKLLAGLLTGAMLLGSMSVSAFAADKTPVIDTDPTKTGSITIHKYEYNGDAAKEGTGEIADASNVPDDARALQGAGFTIYKVAGVNDLKNYYSENPTSLPAVSDYVADGKIKQEYATTKIGEEKTTNSAGIAEFTGLELGFYVVIETKTPDKVTTPVEPFLVSIPMTVKSGDNWLYNVNVYPKNKTTYGGVTLEKKGKDSTPLQGVIFVLQKQNGTTWTPVTISESTNTALNLTTNERGRINVEGLSQGTYRFIETDRGANDGYIMDGATTYQFVVGADGKVTYGSDPAAANITIPVKNEKPDMSKTVQNTAGATKQDADYSVGDLVPYQINVSVPKNIDKLKTFTLTDAPTHLDDKIDTVAIKADNAAIASDAYTKEGDGEHGFKITFDPTKMSDYAGKDIIVTYKAELLDSAVTTKGGKANTATLEYSNKILPDSTDPENPNIPDTPDTPPTTDKITDTAYVYTFQIQIEKKAESEKGTPLANVEFDLYKEITDGTAGNVTVKEAEKAGLDSTKTWKKINATSLKTNTEGIVSQSGLKNGDYYLVETKTNETYNLLKEPVKVTLKIEYTTTTKNEYYTTVEGVRTLVKHEVDTTTFKNDGKDSDGIQIQTVINKKGFTLPLTGGMGTVLFSVIGLALVLAGVVVITASRKKTAK